MCGQLQQSELDAWLCPVRPSIAALTVEVIREETKIKLALMQANTHILAHTFVYLHCN